MEEEELIALKDEVVAKTSELQPSAQETKMHTQIRLILESYELNHPDPGDIGKQ